ncbi:sporulation kinase [Bacillus sp. HMF5848]|uniref:ATP-binding protein n=1 Tax=Bacillus sp. HMF5848 TaxID=2495421 RepID=UPI000F7B11C6|nr:ATP-binding protein [Bacillus sp. HMF5848]RSK25984.1 sporulation kinase [Bacillus sp. HMF5848]
MSQLIGMISYHILVVIFPIIFYHLFVKEPIIARAKIMSKLMLVLLLSLFLTMIIPISFTQGYLYDLRIIPIMIALLYGGVKPAFLIITVMILYRSIVGGEGFYLTLFNYTIALAIITFLRNKIADLDLRVRLIYITCFYLAITISRVVFLLVNKESEQVGFALIFSGITYLTLIISIYIIENLDAQISYLKYIRSAEKLDVVSQLAASVAHEVRNPLTAIKGFLQLIKTEDNLNDDQKKYISISLEELSRTEIVINDYLSLAKPTKDQTTLISLSAEIKSVVDIMMSFTNTHNIAIYSNIQDNLFTQGKNSELKQALLNIMKNGVEAIGTNGSLYVNAFKKHGKIYIKIIDNGIGMNDKQLRKIGTPYYSTKDKGTGVGLTITYNIIKDMNGTITVRSVQGEGTTFTIELPLYSPNIALL